MFIQIIVFEVGFTSSSESKQKSRIIMQSIIIECVSMVFNDDGDIFVSFLRSWYVRWINISRHEVILSKQFEVMVEYYIHQIRCPNLL
mmetsp:Transcript_22018/g.47866  ORF Transcript_22018/g.47866 Transcript_22018/m.47866 type:complete len:88 (-) Transcript_22018:1125-1388(-)